MWTDWLSDRRAFAPQDDGAAGGGSGDDTAAGGGGADTLPAGGGEYTTGGGTPWWKADTFSDEQRQLLEAKGWTTDDPSEALPKIVQAYHAAEKRLGRPADQLLEKPKEGQDVAEWLRQNGELFGIPEKPDGYEIEKPQDWPEGADWDSELEAQAREVAHKHGIPQAALNDLVGVYAGRISGLLTSAEQELAQATQAMQEELQRDWGPQYQAKVAQAQQAASVVAEKAGLDQDAMQNLAAALKPKVGDAGTLRLFAAIGEMMGEDTAKGLNTGGSTLGTTPAQARQQLQEMRAPEGAYAKAVAAGDQAEIRRLQPEIERLTKIAAQGG